MNRFRYPHGRGLYRSRNGIILGVCRGLANFFDLKAFWIRVIVVIFFLASGVWPVLVLYFVASLLMKPEPVRPIESEAGTGILRQLYIIQTEGGQSIETSLSQPGSRVFSEWKTW